jgi:hypothetical protein
MAGGSRSSEAWHLTTSRHAPAASPTLQPYARRRAQYRLQATRSQWVQPESPAVWLTIHAPGAGRVKKILVGPSCPLETTGRFSNSFFAAPSRGARRPRGTW